MLNGKRQQAGFTFLGLLFLISVMGIGMAVTGVIWRQDAQRDREQELIFIGNQFRQAIGAYYERAPGATKTYPKALEDLVDDKRFITTQHHLRRVYRDPMTGEDQWGLVRRPDGAIVGVYSLSQEMPIKSSGFSPEDQQFQKAKQYTDWKFVYLPGNQRTGTTSSTVR